MYLATRSPRRPLITDQLNFSSDHLNVFVYTHLQEYYFFLIFYLLKKLLNHFSNYFNKMESKPSLVYSEYKRILNKLYY